MRLIIFDIDGTLCATAESDAMCYAKAFEQVFGQALPSTNWHDYQYVTDRGVLEEALEWIRGSGPTAEEQKRFEDAFLEEMAMVHTENPEAFQEIPGALAMMKTLLQREDLRISLATGCLRRSALFKLDKIGLDARDIPGGFACDAHSRVDIVKKSIEEAGSHIEDRVYVGDGVWDVRTCGALGIRFVGVTEQSDAARLKAHGAGVCVENFADLERFYAALDSASVPVQAEHMC